MAVIAEYIAVISADPAKFEAGIASVRQKLSNLNEVTGATGSTITASFNQGLPAINATATALNQVAPAASQAGASIQDLALKKANLVGQIKSVDTELRAETKILSELQQASTQFGSGQKAVADALQQSQTKVAGLIASQTQLQGSLTQVNTALKQTQVAATGAAAGIGQIPLAASAASASTLNLRSAMQGLSQGMLLGGTALVAFAAGFGALIKSGSDLQQELVHVAGNTSMSAAEFGNLQQSVIRLGLTTPIAMDQIGKSYMQAANFGFHFADANLVVEAGLKSAVATGANAEASVRALAVAMHIFQIPAAQAAQTMDLLHLAAARGGQTLEQFVGVTGKVFAVAHAMGIGLGDVTSALSALTSAGLPAAQAATLLQGAIVKIAIPAANARKEFERLGIEYGQNALAAKGLSGVLDDIREKVGNNTAEILKLIPAMRGGIGVIILTTTALNDYKDRLKESADVLSGKFKPTQQDAERVMQTVGAQAAILGNSFQALGFEIVKSLGPSLTVGIEALNSVLPTTVLFIGQLPPVILAAGAAFLTAAGAVGAISVALGGLVFILGGPVALAIVGVGLAIGGLAAIVALNFGRINSIISGSAGSTKISFVEIAMRAGAAADAFQILARVAVAGFDIIVTGASLMAEGVRGAFNTIRSAGDAALSLASGDLLGFASAMGKMNDAAINVGASVIAKLAGLGRRLTEDIKDITSHASGQFEVQFGLAASSAGKAFVKASAEQHQAVEDAGLKLVNSYFRGVMKSKEMSDSVWHSMSDDARAAFTATAQAGVEKFNQELISQLNDTANNVGNHTKRVKDQMAEANKAQAELLKEQLNSVNDWLKAIDSKTQISEGVWNKLLAPDTKQALLQAQAGFHSVMDVIQRGQADLLAEQIKGLAGQKKAIDVSSADYARWGSEIEATAEKTGSAINVVFPIIADNVKLVGLALKANSVENKKILDDIAFEHGVAAAKIKASWEDLARDFPINKLKAALKEIKDSLAGNSFFGELKIGQELQREWDSAIRILEQEGERLGETQDQITSRVISGMGKLTVGVGAEAQKAADLAVINFKKGLDKLPGALDEVFNKLALGAKHQVSGIFDIINNIPGKFGDSLRKTTDVITKWINQIDGLLKGLHKIFASIPDGLAGALAQIVALFHGSAAAATAALGSITVGGVKVASGAKTSAGTVIDSWGKAGEGVKTAAMAAGSALAGFTSAMAITAATGSKTAAIITGGIQAALTGFVTSLTFGGPIGAIVGGVSFIGSLIGSLFGGGKSPLQKAQEAAALQKAKDDVRLSQEGVLQAAEQTKQSWITTLDNARALLESISFYSKVPKLAFSQFFADVTKLFNRMAELAKAWKAGATADIKIAAESLAAGVSLLSQLPAALDGISKYLGTPDASFSVFFAAAAKYFIKLEEFLDTIPKSVAKAVGKFSNFLKPGVDLLSPLIEGLNGLFALKELPTDAQFALVDQAIDKIIANIGTLGTRFDKGMLKQMEFFSEKAGAALALWKDTVDAIKATVGIPALTDQDATNLVSGLTLFIDKITTGLQNLDTESLTRVSAIAATILPIASALKAWADTTTAIRGYTVIAADTWDNIVSDFTKAIQLMGVLIGQAIQFEDMATILEGHLKSGTQHLTDGVSAMTSAVLGTASALQGAFGHIQGGAEGSVSAASFASFAPLSSSPISGGTATMGGSSTSTNVTINVHQDAPPPGALTSEREYRQWMRNWWRERAARARALNEPPLPQYLWE